MQINILTHHPFEALHQNATKVIQAAIDRCFAAGGGEVVVPGAGTYMIDGIQLKSHVTLRLEAGAVLKGTGDETRYIKRPGPFELIKNQTPITGLITATGATDIAIVGAGIIDGHYEAFIYPHQGNEQHLKFYHYPRPMTVYLEACTHVKISGVTIQNAPFWTVHLVGCEDTEIDAIKIHNEMRMPNTDGIDVDRSKHTKIHDCEIVTGDDAICPKCTEETAQYGDCTDLTVIRCTLITRSSAVKFGSSSFGNFENCQFSDLVIRDTNRGIAFQLRDPGSARHILFRNISIKTKTFTKEWWGSGEPIYVTLAPRDRATDLTGQVIEAIQFENVTCEAGNGIFVYADGGTVCDVTFKNVKLALTRPFSTTTQFDLRPNEVPETVTADHIGLNVDSTIHVTCEDVTLTDCDGAKIQY